MKIRKICINNFRNLKNINIYPAKTTVIVGENNAGKSNFIHALRLIFDPMADRLRLDLTEADINDEARKAGKLFFTIIVEVGDLQKHIDVEAVFKDRISEVKETKETYITIEGKYEKDAEGYYAFTVNVLSPEGKANDPQKMTFRMNKTLPLFFLEALRDAERDTRATGRSLLAQMLAEVDFSDVQEDIQHALREANSALSSGKDVSVLTEGITNQLTQLTPGGQSQIKLSVSDEDPLNIRRNFRLGYQKSPAHDLSDLSRHGTGLQNLALIAIFRHRISTSKVGSPILAIEEPEAHLHPHAQRRLYRELDETAAPVFITTHSPSLVKFADPMGLVLFRSENDVTTSFQLSSERINTADLKNIEQLMRGGRAELFFARSLIVVEGQSELIVIPAFAENIGCDLDRDGISLVEAGNNNFAFILNSCGASNFSIPSSIIYDTDDLRSGNGLLKEAYKAQLIDIKKREEAEQLSGDDQFNQRKTILDEIGWFGAVECLEEEVCANGYMDVVLEVIQNNDKEHHSDQRAFESFLNGQPITSKLVTKFIKHRGTLKIPVAQGIYNAVATKGCVPAIYENAIRKAVLMSQQGLIVDNFFEARAWSSGFKNLLFSFIHERNLIDQYQNFVKENVKGFPLPIQFNEFAKSNSFPKEFRVELKNRISGAILACGCSEFAKKVRESAFIEEG
jgi:putative ATP-dependent endonuclease of the OLD family